MIPKEIRQQVNRAAHYMAWQYEYRVRDAMLARLMEIAESGATTDDLIRTLKQIEAQPPQV